MREIKFRAFHKPARQWLVFREELFTFDDELVFEIKCADDCVVMQYTGLKDKNGKEIYEGDIVGWNFDGRNLNGVIEWSGNGFWIISEGEKWMPNTCAIIGNIYENPELLQE